MPMQATSMQIAANALPEKHGGFGGHAMADTRPRVLIVEDNLLIALFMQELLEDCGYQAIGPAARIEDALELIRREPLDGAVLDINLGDERVWPVADALNRLNIPFVLATGYNAVEIPTRHRSRVRLTKPLSEQRLDQALKMVGIESG